MKLAYEKMARRVSLAFCSALTLVMLYSFNVGNNPFLGQHQRKFEAWLGTQEQVFESALSEHKPSESPPTGILSTQALSTQALSTQALPSVAIQWNKSGQAFSWKVHVEDFSKERDFEKLQRILHLIRESKFFYYAKPHPGQLRQSGLAIRIQSEQEIFEGYVSARRLSRNIALQNMLQIAKR